MEYVFTTFISFIILISLFYLGHKAIMNPPYHIITFIISFTILILSLIGFIVSLRYHDKFAFTAFQLARWSMMWAMWFVVWAWTIWEVISHQWLK